MIEEPDLTAVEEFGPYLVYERLGVGGMATVHRALERGIEDFERIVALKRLLPHLAEDSSFIKSFVREAKLASTLQHANIVQTLELGRVGPTYFISMEYIDGRDVRKILRHARKVSGPPPINVTLALMLQLCDALDYAHNRTDSDGNPLGIVHRDLSPSNLLLTRSGHLKVIDFGIAKAQAAHLATQTGRVKGKLAYMAPESISGKELDARSDLFAMGVVFHELLTARPLFAQKNEYQTLLKVQRGDVSAPSTFNEGVPKELDDVVLRALAKEPDDRWESAAALRDALVSVRMARQLSATPRDVTTWCDWAFALDVGGFSGKTFTEGLVSGTNAFGGTASPIAGRTPTPRPYRPGSEGHGPDDEAAAEIAWGAPEIGAGVPHIHDEVPDVSGKLAPSAVMAAAVESGVSEARTEEHASFAGLLDPSSSAGATQPDMKAATIKTLSVPPPASKTDVRPAAFPAGSSNDALLRARPRTITIPPKADGLVPPRSPTGEHPTLRGTAPRSATGEHPTLRGTAPGARPAPSSRPPPIPSVPPIPPGPATARGSTVNLLSDLDSADGPPPTPVHMTRPQRAVSVGPTIGAAIATRKTHAARNAIIALVVLGGAATAITLAATMGDDKVVVPSKPTIEPLPRTNGTVKFVIEPADAMIRLAANEPHTGSPWTIQLPPGLHQVEIVRDGYKSWLTSIELSGGETQTLRVVLEQVAGGSAATATLIVDPSMPGLDVELDGTVLDRKTPLRIDVPPGPHHVALRQDGAELWAQDFTALANATHEFDPSMSDEKRRERRHRHDRTDTDSTASSSSSSSSRPTASREATTAPVRPDVATTTVPPAPAPSTLPGTTAPGTAKPPGAMTSTTTPPRANNSSVAGTTATSAGPRVPTPTGPAMNSGTTTTPTPTPTPTPVNPTPTPAPTPAPAPKSGAPEVIPPSAVSRTSGTVPSLKGGSSLASERLPANISAKVCISTGGSVTSASVLTKVPAEVKTKLEVAIRGWKYTPYKKNGAATTACFVASFRSK